MMNANKTVRSGSYRVGVSFLALGLLLSAPATALEGSAPALLGVQEIQVQHGRLGNNAASDMCGLSSSDAATQVLNILKEEQLPVFAVMDAPMPRMGIARIDLLPEIVSLQREGLDCTSYVSLTAQTHSTVRVPPIETPRNVWVTYWRGGLMISSTQVGHLRAVREALTKLSQQFAKQYRSDQPPPLPELGEPGK